MASSYVAKSGYANLHPAVKYRRIDRGENPRRVILGLLSSDGAKHKVVLVHVDRDVFEDGLLKGFIVRTDDAQTLPPHLSKFENCDIALIDDVRSNLGKATKTKHFETVENRVALVMQLLEIREKIFCAPNPTKIINKFAEDYRRNHGKYVNAKRLCYWFYLYRMYDENRWALLPDVVNNGRWDRFKYPDGVAYGRRPNPEKMPTKHLTKEMIGMLIGGFEKFSKPGVTMYEIYVKVMTQIFKGISVKIGKHEYWQTEDGTPLPGFRRFRYRIYRHLGKLKVKELKQGFIKFRNSTAAYRGKTSEAITNALERVETDANYTKDHPRGRIDNSILPKLCIYKLVCNATGLLTGIGFTIGKETSEGYNFARFCAAIPKPLFCKIMGVPMEPWEWPTQGVAAYEISDRGPGVKREPGALSEFSDGTPGTTIREIAPSRQGQSKPNIESSHHRTAKTEEDTTVIVSNLTVIQMMRREIENLLADNRGSDATARMTNEMVFADVEGTPLAIYDYLNKRDRVLQRNISVPEAVRKYLMPTRGSVGRDGINLGHQNFNSPELKDSKILEDYEDFGEGINCYVLPICVAYIWAELKGEIFMVQAQQPMNDHRDQIFMTLVDLEQCSARRGSIKASIEQTSMNARIKASQRFTEVNKIEPYAGKTMSAAKASKLSKKSRDLQDELSIYGARNA